MRLNAEWKGPGVVLCVRVSDFLLCRYHCGWPISTCIGRLNMYRKLPNRVSLLDLGHDMFNRFEIPSFVLALMGIPVKL